MIEYLFWIFVLIIIYAYFGYGILLQVLSVFWSNPAKARQFTPTVSVIIAAYNEEISIEDKLKNTLELIYPEGKLEIIVGSDSSSDNTDAIVNRYASRGVKLIRVEGRLGKTGVQNECVKIASGEIIVFTDATTILDPNSITYITSNFADEQVGCVGGHLKYVNSNQSLIGGGNTTYWSYESLIKQKESEINSLIGVSGCFYAVRKNLYEHVPRNLISDFVIALHTVKKGYRVVFEPKAICYEVTLDNVEEEMQMRERVALRSYRALLIERSLLNPFTNGFYAIQLISHKLLRYSVPILLILVFTLNLLLLDIVLYRFIFLAQLLFYFCAFYAHYIHLSKKSSKLLVIPYYFVLVNYSALKAFIKFCAGHEIVVWEPKR